MAFEMTSNPYDVLNPVDVSSDIDEVVDTTGDVDSSADDSSTDDAAEDTATDDGSEEAEASDEGDSAEEGDPDQAANAKADEAAWKAKDGNIPPALKEIINANPQAAKRLKEMYFQNQRLSKFGAPAEIRKMKEAVDAVGGADKLIDLKNQIDQMGGEAGFQEAQQELGAWRELDNKWQNDASGCADHLFEANALAAEKLAPVMFNKLGEANPELYDNLASQLIYNTFAQSGTLMNFQLMEQALAAGNTQLAGQYYDKVKAVMGNIQKLASQAPKSKAVDPRQQAFDKKEKSFEDERQEVFQKEVLQSNRAWMDPKVTGELTAYLGTSAPKNNSRIVQAVKEEIWKNHLSNNPSFMKSRTALTAKRDGDGLDRLYKQHIPEKLWQKVTRDICAEFGLRPGGKKTATPPTAAAKTNGAAKSETGFSRVTKYPNPEEVDRSKTTQDMIIKDQFVLKSGQKIQYVGSK